MQIDGIYRDKLIVCLNVADIKLLADLCNDLSEDMREWNPAHLETLGAALETAELAMQWIPEPKAVTP